MRCKTLGVPGTALAQHAGDQHHHLHLKSLGCSGSVALPWRLCHLAVLVVFFMRLSTERTPEANNKFGGAGVHISFRHQFSCAKQNEGLMSTTWICKVLHLGQGNAKHRYRQGTEKCGEQP